jgi:hypothetical protein
MRDIKTFEYLTERHFNDIMNGVIRTPDSRCPTTFYYYKNDILILRHSTKINNAFVDYNEIFLFFMTSFNLTSKELKKLLSPIIGKYLGYKGISIWTVID